MFNLISTGPFAIAIFIMEAENSRLNAGNEVRNIEKKTQRTKFINILLNDIDNLPNKLRLKMPNSNVSADRSLCSEQFSSLSVNLWPIFDSIFDNNDTTYTNSTVQNR